MNELLIGNFFVMTKNGTKPPSYVHGTINSATIEAKRLHELYKTEVLILEIVGRVSLKEVPVTKLETVVELDSKFDDELPF